jgi:hypothetical protein
MTGSLVSVARRWIADPGNPQSISARRRRHRWDELVRRFPDLDSMRVLDLGGTPAFWRTAPRRPAHVTTVNLEPGRTDEPWLRHLVDDACVPTTLGHEQYDLVVSNSLLEHVGGHGRRRLLAEVIQKSAPAHWVQTPYRYFPIEPHWLAPGWQFLPAAGRAAVLSQWPFCHTGRPRNRDDALRIVLETELIGLAELRMLFPRSDVWRERAGGLTKSIVAVRTSAS